MQREAARWVGQLLEAVSHVPESRKFDDLLAEHQVKVLDTFGDKLSEALDEGRELIRARQFELDQAAGVARSTAERKKALRDQDKTAKLEKGIEGAVQEKENAKKTEQEWKKWLDDMLAASDKQLGQLERDYNFLDQRSQSLLRSYTLAGTQLTAMNLSLSLANMKNMDSFLRGDPEPAADRGAKPDAGIPTGIQCDAGTDVGCCLSAATRPCSNGPKASNATKTRPGSFSRRRPISTNGRPG